VPGRCAADSICSPSLRLAKTMFSDDVFCEKPAFLDTLAAQRHL
jgi:hypothetical protein